MIAQFNHVTTIPPSKDCCTLHTETTGVTCNIGACTYQVHMVPGAPATQAPPAFSAFQALHACKAFLAFSHLGRTEHGSDTPPSFRPCHPLCWPGQWRMRRDNTARIKFIRRRPQHTGRRACESRIRSSLETISPSALRSAILAWSYLHPREGRKSYSKRVECIVRGTYACTDDNAHLELYQKVAG